MIEGSNVVTFESLWGVKETAGYLGVSQAWVRDHCTRKQPRLLHLKIRKLLRFRPADIERFVEEQLQCGDQAA